MVRFILRHAYSLLSLALLFITINVQAMTHEEALQTLGNQRSNFNDKALAIKALYNSNESYVTQIFEGLVDGKLYFFKNSGTLYYKTENNSYIDIINHTVFQGKTRDLKRIAVNNSIRSLLETSISLRKISDSNSPIDERIEYAHNLIGKVDGDALEEIAALRDLEYAKNPELSQMLNFVIASSDLKNPDPKIRNGALRILGDFSSPLLISTFDSIAKNDSDPGNRAYAASLSADLKAKQTFYSGAQTVYFGLSLGSVLVLSAIGLTITFGVMGVINMAHGELMMIGAYTVYVMQQCMPQNPGLALILSIPVAFLVSGLAGIIIERTVIRFLYNRPLETLLATFGISLLLQQGVRSIFSALNKNVVVPEFLAGSIKINDFLTITNNRLYIILFCLAVFFALRHILLHSRLGLNVRAVSQNRAMARNMGVHSGRVQALTFGLGSGIAGLAGVALSMLTNVGPNLGQNYIVDSFMVVVFGGAGNIWGTMVAGMTLGLANKFLEPISGAMLAKIIILVGVILFIQKRPRGLFPQKGRNAED